MAKNNNTESVHMLAVAKCLSVVPQKIKEIAADTGLTSHQVGKAIQGLRIGYDVDIVLGYSVTAKEQVVLRSLCECGGEDEV